MATVEETLVRDVMVQPTNIISADESLGVANRVMSGQTVRSLLVIDGDHLAGVVFISDVQDAEPATPVRSVMHQNPPILKADSTIGEARAAIGEFDYDMLPVVDDQGMLIGEVPRQTVVHADHQVTGSREDVTLELPQHDGSARRMTLRSGMEVSGANGNKLGTVDEIYLEGDRPTAFTVKHGMVSKKHKQLTVDIIDRVDDDTLVLRIDKTEFKFLADVEAEE